MDRAGVGVPGLGDGAAELLQEHGQRAQLARVDEVEEAPQLLQVVLQRRPGQDQPVRRGQLLHRQRHLGVRVPDLVSFKAMKHLVNIIQKPI